MANKEIQFAKNKLKEITTTYNRDLKTMKKRHKEEKEKHNDPVSYPNLERAHTRERYHLDAMLDMNIAEFKKEHKIPDNIFDQAIELLDNEKTEENESSLCSNSLDQDSSTTSSEKEKAPSKITKKKVQFDEDKGKGELYSSEDDDNEENVDNTNNSPPSPPPPPKKKPPKKSGAKDPLEYPKSTKKPAPKKARVRWRKKGKKFFLTYNGVDENLNADTVLDRILQEWGVATFDEDGEEVQPGLIRAAVVEDEAPTTGKRHMHVIMEHQDALDFGVASRSQLDMLVASDKHPEGIKGNYQTMREFKYKYDFYIKPKPGRKATYGCEPGDKGAYHNNFDNDDPEYKQFVAEEKSKVKKKAVWDRIMEEVKKGRNWKWFRNQPEFQGVYARSSERIKKLCAEESILLRKPKEIFKELKKTKYDTPESWFIKCWINENFKGRDELGKRIEPAKEIPALWIYGKTGVGKTHIATAFMDRWFLLYDLASESYDDNWQLLDWDGIRINEYKPDRDIRWIMKMCFGEPTHMTAKGVGSHINFSKYPIIVTAQHEPLHYFPTLTLEEQAAIKRRFFTVHLTENLPDKAFPVPGLKRTWQLNDLTRENIPPPRRGVKYNPFSPIDRDNQELQEWLQAAESKAKASELLLAAEEFSSEEKRLEGRNIDESEESDDIIQKGVAKKDLLRQMANEKLKEAKLSGIDADDEEDEYEGSIEKYGLGLPFNDDARSATGAGAGKSMLDDENDELEEYLKRDLEEAEDPKIKQSTSTYLEEDEQEIPELYDARRTKKNINRTKTSSNFVPSHNFNESEQSEDIYDNEEPWERDIPANQLELFDIPSQEEREIRPKYKEQRFEKRTRFPDQADDYADDYEYKNAPKNKRYRSGGYRKANDDNDDY